MQKRSIIRAFTIAGSLAIPVIGSGCVTNGTVGGPGNAIASGCFSVTDACNGFNSARPGFGSGNTFYTAPSAGNGAYYGGSYSPPIEPYRFARPIQPAGIAPEDEQYDAPERNLPNVRCGTNQMGGDFAPQCRPD